MSANQMLLNLYKPLDQSRGLCQIECGFADRYILHALFRCWSKFSGEVDYPVVGGFRAYVSYPLYDPFTNYGQLRLELRSFLIQRLRLLAAAKTLEAGNFKGHLGLCNTLNIFFINRYIREAFTTWEEFSGDYNYPIEGSRCLSAAGSFHYHAKRGTLYKGRYGAARMRLAAHLAKEFRKVAFTKE